MMDIFHSLGLITAQEFVDELNATDPFGTDEVPIVERWLSKQDTMICRPMNRWLEIFNEDRV
jgi:hypothetical protein